MPHIKDLENRIADLKHKEILLTKPVDNVRFSGDVPVSQNDGSYMWPGKRSVVYMEGEYTVPKEFLNRKVYLRLNPFIRGPILPEGMLYIDGELFHGLDRFHYEVLLPDTKPCGKISAKLWDWEDIEVLGIKSIDIISVNNELRSLVYDLSIALDRIKAGNIDDFHSWTQTIDMALRIAGDGESIEKINDAAKLLSVNIYTGPRNASSKQTFIGNSHIDIAWLWTLATTRDKCQHTFATVLRMMEQYPEYIYTQSQPHIYEYIREDAPKVFEEIKRRIGEGRWDADGALWVESDCNIPSGESLVRQLLFGKRYFENELGVQSRVAWLPDVFGYPASLPQILKKSGVDFFVTSKLSCNQYDKYPHDTFTWRGIDGTEITSYFITTPNLLLNTACYAGTCTVEEVLETWNRYKDKDINDETIFVYGHGDGGGGPTPEMLERFQRLANMPGIPECRTGKLLPFLERLEASINGNPDMSVWDGELYFELHRGTYTSQAWIKRQNRKAEVEMYNAEFIASLAYVYGMEYPKSDLERSWKLILLNQFHDIIAGSSIEAVYKDSAKDYADVFAVSQSTIDRSISYLKAHEAIEGSSVVVFNQLSWQRRNLIELPLENVDLIGTDEKTVASQAVSGGTVFAVDVPSMGFSAYSIRPKAPGSTETPDGCKVSPDGRIIENRFYRIEFGLKGEITRLFDKIAQREVLSASGNMISAFEDKPFNYGADAWDIDIIYEKYPIDLPENAEVEVLEVGPIRACVSFKRTILNSCFEQKVYIYKDGPRIDFITNINWNENHVLLKVLFPLNIRSRTATYEIQYGTCERPTHRNTSWDMAKFEVPAQKWADISERGYGVSLLNDCKYGYSAKDNILGLTLIKSATMPDPNQDQGDHEFTYSIYPHADDWRNGTVKESYDLNYPLIVKICEGGEPSHASKKSYVQLDSDHFIITAIKKAEDEDGLILRGYETDGGRGCVEINTVLPVAYIQELDLMEKAIEESKRFEDGKSFDIAPYEIKTFVLDSNSI